MIASEVDPIIPVFAIPVFGRTFGQIDSFGSCIQMPEGIPLGVISKPSSIPNIIKNINNALTHDNAPKVLVLHDRHIKSPISTFNEMWLFKESKISFLEVFELSPTIIEQIRNHEIQMIIYYTEIFDLTYQLENLYIPVIVPIGIRVNFFNLA